MQKIYLSFIIILYFSSFAQRINYHWEEIQSPTQNSIVLLGNITNNEIIICNSEGELFRYKDDNWTDLKISTDLSLNPYIFWRDKEQILCAAVDQKWNTHFYILENSIWNKFEYVHNNPITNIFKAKNKIYAIGAWGSFLTLSKGKWRKIDAPFTKHVNSYAVDNGGNIWLGISADKIYKYNHIEFTSFEIDDEITADFYQFNFEDNSILEVLINSRYVFQMENNVFVKGRKFQSKDWQKNSYEKFGFIGIDFTSKDRNKLTVKIPSDFEMMNYRFLPDSTLIVSSRSGKIYIGSPIEISPFINLARTYKVEGSPYSNTLGAAFIDISGEGNPDLFVFNSNPDEHSSFYLNKPNSPFTESSIFIDLFPNISSSVFTFTDINSNDRIDLIVSSIDSIGASVKIFTNIESKILNPPVTIYLPKDYNQKPIRNISAIDFDGDGDLDINLTLHYGKNLTSGGEIILDNSLLGENISIDTSIIKETSGWNTQTIFADFTNDDNNEIYIVNMWDKNKLLVKNGNYWRDEAQKRFENLIRTESDGASAFDYDNDGDLDLLILSDTLFLTLYQNNGNGFFKDVTEQTKLNIISSKYIGRVSIRNICVADFNNDGFDDIFITLKDPEINENYLMMNKNGKYFVDEAELYGLKFPTVKGAVAADIDNDGDIDLFGYSSNSNILWINTRDDNSYIKIKLKGVISNNLGISAKIWLYEMTGNEEKLWSYKQIGTERFGINQLNDLTAHFGVDENKIYKAKVKFYQGKEITKSNIRPGTTITITELGPFASMIYNFPSMFYRFVTQREVQYYVLLFIFAIFVVYLGIRFGIKRFNWEIKNAYWIGSAHLLLFWIIFIASYNSPSFIIKFILPAVVLIVGIALINFGFYWSSLIGQKKVSIIAGDELFELLRNFSHGEWALKNLNSLILFFKNITETRNSEYEEQLSKRIETYNGLTKENIKKILELASIAGLSNHNLKQMSRLLIQIDSELELYTRYEVQLNETELALKFQQLKFYLSELRNNYFTEYSCDPHKVISQISSHHSELFIEKNIDFQLLKEYNGNRKALIKSFELADILDNLFVNAVNSFDSNNTRRITLFLKWHAPKVIIEIINTGNVIPLKIREKIFEDGFSTRGSSGRGLYASKNILKKYGGNISLVDSTRQAGTIFVIELQEGY
ncbi:MAG TPA: GHKL domain-containing protein [Ignavibacteria bacterium]|nr:GHKL domain-containing protein [Ignavibacteria bacterium]